MAIGFVEIQGSITRTQDYAQIRHNEENKDHSEQLHLSNTTQKDADVKANTVERREDVSQDPRKFDAREKGSNEYHGDGGKDRNKKTVTTDGKVFVKNQNSSFDIKI